MVYAVSECADLAEAVRTVLKQEISRLFGESNPQSFNKCYLSQHSNSIPHRLAGTQHTRMLTSQAMSIIIYLNYKFLLLSKLRFVYFYLLTALGRMIDVQFFLKIHLLRIFL